MVQAISCPGADALQRLLLGQTGDEESPSLEEHLIHCERCLHTIQSLPTDDPLISALRQGHAPAIPTPNGELLEKLRQRLQQARPVARANDTATADREAGTVPPAEPFERTEDGLSLAPPQRPDEIGRLGGYRILKELGRGGMGVVYLAEDPKLKRAVALKCVLPGLAASPRTVQRFLREAQAMAAVEHDHIVRIYQVDEDRGVPFLAMEFLKGEPLDERMKREEKMPLAESLRIAREIAEGLGAAHERGLMHRDIKPGNVWLEAPRGRVKILDFGLARAAREESGLTQQGAILGTPAYMAPEQAKGEAVDGRCDLFSLGVVLYRLTTGKPPFRGSDAISTLMEVAMHLPPSPIQLNPQLPQELSDMVMKLLEKDPARRFASAGEVVQALLTLERKLARERDVEVRTEALTAAPPKRRPLPRILLAAAALLLLGLAGGLIGVATGLIRIQTPQGDYVINTDDQDFFFQVHDGAVKLEDRKNNKTYTLKVVHEDKDAGEFLLEATDGELAFKTKTFTIKRGDTVALTALFEPKPIAADVMPPPIADAFMQKVAGLFPNQQVDAVAAELKSRNPDFDGKVAYELKDGVVTVVAFSADQVADLSPVRALTGLRTLKCTGTSGGRGRLADLSPLKGMKLTELDLTRTQVADLSPLKGMALTSLDCDSTPVSDLAPLQGMPLNYLSCEATKVTLLAPLKGMPLTRLRCSSTKVSDLAPLKDMKLSELSCWNTPVSDLAPLRDMKLTSLNCDRTPVSDLAPLKDMMLTSLDCHSTKVTDLSPLKGMPLKHLGCDYAPERDADILRSIKTLQTINDKPAAEFWKDMAVAVKLPLDNAWVKQLAAMPADKQVEAVAAELKKRNPGFDGMVTPKIEDGVVVELQLASDEITDIAPVRALSGLEMLDCCAIRHKGRSFARLADLSPLMGMKLTTLQCGYTSVSDLSPLKDMKLTYLNCGETPLSDLSPLKDMKLSYLNCGGTKVSDLSPLKGMPLTDLVCSKTNVTDLSPLKGMPLKVLWCNVKSERDAEVLRAIATLETINGKPAAEFRKDAAVGAKPPVDDAWLKQVAALPAEKQVEAVAAKLKELNPGFDGMVSRKVDNGVVTTVVIHTDDVADVSPLRALTGLRSVSCGASQKGGPLADLSPLKDLKLTSLDLNYTKVADLSPLKDMKLTDLSFHTSLVVDLAPLKDMPLTKLSFYRTKVSDLSPLRGVKLTSLDFNATPVSDLAPLQGMPLTFVNCNNTQVADLSPLKGMQLATLDCTHTPVSDLSPLQGMPLATLSILSTKVSDLSPLRGMTIKHLACDFNPERDADILRSIKTLQTINGKPAAEFWKEVDAKKP